MEGRDNKDPNKAVEKAADANRAAQAAFRTDWLNDLRGSGSGAIINLLQLFSKEISNNKETLDFLATTPILGLVFRGIVYTAEITSYITDPNASNLNKATNIGARIAAFTLATLAVALAIAAAPFFAIAASCTIAFLSMGKLGQTIYRWKEAHNTVKKAEEVDQLISAYCSASERNNLEAISYINIRLTKLLAEKETLEKELAQESEKKFNKRPGKIARIEAQLVAYESLKAFEIKQAADAVPAKDTSDEAQIRKTQLLFFKLEREKLIDQKTDLIQQKLKLEVEASRLNQVAKSTEPQLSFLQKRMLASNIKTNQKNINTNREKIEALDRKLHAYEYLDNLSQDNSMSDRSDSIKTRNEKFVKNVKVNSKQNLEATKAAREAAKGNTFQRLMITSLITVGIIVGVAGVVFPPAAPVVAAVGLVGVFVLTAALGIAKFILDKQDKNAAAKKAAAATATQNAQDQKIQHGLGHNNIIEAMPNSDSEPNSRNNSRSYTTDTPNTGQGSPNDKRLLDNQDSVASFPFSAAQTDDSKKPLLQDQDEETSNPALTSKKGK